MSHEDAKRIVAAAHRVRAREGAGFPLTQLARPAGMSRATLYRRLAADTTLAAEIERIRTEGARSPREELLRAATALLAEKGFAGLTMDEVAERAGLSTATLYRYFADRDGLVREMVRTSLPSEPVRKTLMEDGPLDRVLERFVEAALSRLQRQPHLLRFLLLGDENELREMRKFRQDQERLSTTLVELFEQRKAEFVAAQPTELAAALMGQVLGAVVFLRTHENAAKPDPHTLVKIFLHGARSKQERKGPK